MNIFKRAAHHAGSAFSIAGMYLLRWAHGDPFAPDEGEIAQGVDEVTEDDDDATFPVELSPEAQRMIERPMPPPDPVPAKRKPKTGSLAERIGRHSAKG